MANGAYCAGLPHKSIIPSLNVHIVGRNASDSKPAKFVVVLVKKQGVPALLPAK